MNRFTVEQYALSACFACFVGLVIAVATAAFSVVEIYVPEFSMPRADLEYRATVTNDSYWKWLSSVDKQLPRPSDDELTKRRSEAHRELLTAYSQSAKGTLLQSLIYIAVLTAVLVGHWRLAAKFRNVAPAST